MKTLYTCLLLSLFIIICSLGCRKSHSGSPGPYSNMQKMAGRRYWTGIDRGATIGTDTTAFYYVIDRYVTLQVNEPDSTIIVQDTAMNFTLFNLNGTYTFQSIDTLGKLMVFFNYGTVYPTNYVIYYYADDADSLQFFGTYNNSNGYELVNISSN